MTHTPGPWEVLAGTVIESKKLNKTITTVPEENASLGFFETRANARLIAAAPQLLEALERSVELIDVIMAYAENTPSPVVLNAATIGQEIEQALAAAKGQDYG